MVRLQNHIGKIDISEAYFEDLVSDAVNSSFGVAAMSETSSARGFWNKVLKKDSHKGMVIGKKGAMLKEIATLARQDMEALFGVKVNLQCWVKVKEDWRNRQGLLNSFGYRL